jgi:hypothetical protein
MSCKYLISVLLDAEIPIGKLKKHKSPDSDQIPASLIQAGGEILRPDIHKLINSISNKEELSDHRKASIIIPIYKSGGKIDCSYFRGYHSYQLHTKFYPIFFSQG